MVASRLKPSLKSALHLTRQFKMIQCLLLFILLTEQTGEKHGVSISAGSVSACFCIDLHVAETALFSSFFLYTKIQLY